MPLHSLPIHHISPVWLLLLHATGGAAGVSPVRQRAEIHLPDDLGEKLVHHGLTLSRRLHEGAAPVLGQGLALAGGHLPLLLQVHFVAHQHHWHLLVPADEKGRAVTK